MAFVAIYARGGRRDVGWNVVEGRNVLVMDFGFWTFDFFIDVAPLRLEVAAFDIGKSLEKYRPQLVVDGHVVMRGEVGEPLCRVLIRFRQDVFYAQPL